MSEQRHDDEHEHGHSARPYVLTWLALLVLTAVSYWVANVDLGGLDSTVMLLVAVVKATLVVYIFMHLSEARFATRFVVVVSAMFVALLVVLTTADVATRTTFPVAPHPEATGTSLGELPAPPDAD